MILMVKKYKLNQFLRLYYEAIHMSLTLVIIWIIYSAIITGFGYQLGKLSIDKDKSEKFQQDEKTKNRKDK